MASDNATSVTETGISAHASATTLVVWVLVSTIQSIPPILYVVATFVTITIPTWLYTLLTVSLTVTVNFSTLALLALILLSTASYIFRYRYHSYGRALPEPGRKEPAVEVPAPQGDSKPGLSNYLDEFLSAIKVFGFLEKPVFHELTRTMHTRRLAANETFLLEEEKGFCLVVEGTVQIFAKSTGDNNANTRDNGLGDSPFDDHYHGYQLLTEIKNGSPMSSLFNILSLFTDEVLTPEDQVPQNDTSRARRPSQRRAGSLILTRENVSKDKTSKWTTPLTPVKSRSQPASRMGSPNLPAGHITQIPPLILDSEIHRSPASVSSSHAFHQPEPEPEPEPELYRTTSGHPQIVARAAEDSTIAIIPASAFRRLTRMYPKSTAHVVQVILSRFYRVTLATAYRYLGLTYEVLETERQMNKIVDAVIPNILLDSSLERLKGKFLRERERLGPEDISKGIALHNPNLSRKRRQSSSNKKDAGPHQMRNVPATGKTTVSSWTATDNARFGISAGDLLKSKGGVPLKTPLHKVSSPLEDSYFHPRTLLLRRQDSMDDGLTLREAVLNCMCSAMGLSATNSLPKNESVEPSPRLVSYDTKRNKAVFNTVFGLMEPLDQAGDGDTESTYSQSTAALNTPQSSNILSEIVESVEIVWYQNNTTIVSQLERPAGLYFVIDGFLEVGTAEHSFLVTPGSFAAYLTAVGGFRSFFDIKAKSDVILGFLPRESLNRLVERYPVILLTLSRRLTSLLDRLILHIDFALEYLQVDAGQTIYEQNETSDAIYIILSGRLRAIQEQSDRSVRVLSEYGQGDSVGELEILTESVRPGSLHAIRDSELARLPMSLFNSLAQEKPAITLKMSKVLAKKMRSLIYQKPLIDSAKERSAIGGARNTSSIVNLRTVGVLPVREGVPVSEFASYLETALIHAGVSVIALGQAQIREHLGRHAFNKMGKLKLSQYLADLEEKYDLVLYVCDSSVQSPWTTTCILQSDCILVVGVADSSPAIGEYERVLLAASTTARKELVLLHPERYCTEGITRKWLNNRIWINGGHHHMQMVGLPTQSYQRRNNPSRLSAVIKQRMQSVQNEIQKYTGQRRRQAPLYSSVPTFKNDFHRLARRLCGKSIGLVLGGGGARGISHVGIIRAMEEAGIPIDIVGGTSIGAFVGALYAWDAGVVTMYGRIRRFSAKMASIWRFALDLTYPT
jgi:lysophospholipid hydrolase